MSYDREMSPRCSSHPQREIIPLMNCEKLNGYCKLHLLVFFGVSCMIYSTIFSIIIFICFNGKQCETDKTK
jgi:hypothetical protein